MSCWRDCPFANQYAYCSLAMRRVDAVAPVQCPHSVVQHALLHPEDGQAVASPRGNSSHDPTE